MNSASGFDDPKRLVEQGYDQVAGDYARLEGGNRVAPNALAPENAQ